MLNNALCTYVSNTLILLQVSREFNSVTYISLFFPPLKGIFFLGIWWGRAGCGATAFERNELYTVFPMLLWPTLDGSVSPVLPRCLIILHYTRRGTRCNTTQDHHQSLQSFLFNQTYFIYVFSHVCTRNASVFTVHPFLSLPGDCQVWGLLSWSCNITIEIMIDVNQLFRNNWYGLNMQYYVILNIIKLFILHKSFNIIIIKVEISNTIGRVTRKEQIKKSHSIQHIYASQYEIRQNILKLHKITLKTNSQK